MNFAQQGVEEMPKQEAVLQSCFNRLEKACANYNSMICDIEDKMHTILNLRKPEDPEKQGRVEDMKDFVSSLNAKVAGVEYLNIRLQGIYRHLQQII